MENLPKQAVVTQAPDAADKTENLRGSLRESANPPDQKWALFRPAEVPGEIGRLGSYRIVKLLGRGGMGGVYLAEDLRLRRQVALKVMLPDMIRKQEARARFFREAEMAAAIEHDHIVAIYQIDEDHGTPFLAMPLLRGQGLEDRLQKGPPLDWRDIVQIGRETALGLAAAHKVGLIHRDIKPGNLWLETKDDSDTQIDGASNSASSPSTFRVKILDFGLARPAEEDTGITKPGFILGSPMYMAPEQARGGTLDGRSDLFSLGVTLYRLCTGELPFQGPDTMSVLLAVTTHDPTPPHERNASIPRALSDLIMDLLAKAPDQRPASAREVAQRLATLADQPDLGETLQVAESTRAAPRRPWLFLAGLAAVLLAAIGAIIVFQGNQGDFIIESEDDDISFKINKNKDTVTLRDEKNQRDFQLKMYKEAGGAIMLEVIDPRDGLSFLTNQFTIKRGEKVAARAWFRPKEATPVKLPPPATKEREAFTFGPWGEPENLGPGINTERRELGATLTADERVLVFTRDDRKLMISRRRNINEAFPRAEPLSETINLQVNGNPTMTGDGLLLAFASDRPGSAKEDIWVSSRKSVDEPFGDPVRLPETINTPSWERCPLFSSDGLTFLVTSVRAKSGGDIFLYRRTSRDEPFAEGKLLPEPVSSPAFDLADWITDDGRVLITTKMEMPPWETRLHTFDALKKAFSEPQLLTLPKPHDRVMLGRPWLSADGQRMYFHARDLHNGHGELDLWMVRKVTNKQ